MENVLAAFSAIDLRVGTIQKAEVFEGARKPAFQLWLDFGPDIGLKKSSAQLTELYQPQDLVGRQVIGLVNTPHKQIANFMSECLVLGVYGKEGVVLLSTERPCQNGDKIG